MGNGVSRQVMPICNQDYRSKNCGLSRTQSQKRQIIKPFQQINQNYQTIRPLETISSDVVNGVVGLKNLGNTCYFNAALHCIAHTQPLLDCLLSEAYSYNKNSQTKGEITKNLVKLFKEIWDNKNCFVELKFKKPQNESVQREQLKQFKCVDPSDLLFCIQKYTKRFKNGNYESKKYNYYQGQEDCQELLQFLFDFIHQELNRANLKNEQYKQQFYGQQIELSWATESWEQYLKQNRSIIVDIFQGQLKSTCKCNFCGLKSYSWDPFLFLTLPVPKQQCTIYDCIDLMQQSETLSENCKWFCPNCQKNQIVQKQLELWKTPNQLIVHLKRFQYEQGMFSKIYTTIEIPLELDLSRYNISQPTTDYYLYAIAQHSGNYNNGHYTCICKSQNNNWYKYDDEKIQKIVNIQKELQNDKSYILFYQRYDSVLRQTLNNQQFLEARKQTQEQFKQNNQLFLEERKQTQQQLLQEQIQLLKSPRTNDMSPTQEQQAKF